MPFSALGAPPGHRWNVDLTPYNVDARLPTPWVPQALAITVQLPDGPILQVNTVRLRRR